MFNCFQDSETAIEVWREEASSVGYGNIFIINCKFNLLIGSKIDLPFILYSPRSFSLLSNISR